MRTPAKSGGTMLGSALVLTLSLIHIYGALGFCTRISTDKSLEADQYALELSGILNLYKVAGENIEGAIISLSLIHI